LAQVGPYRGSTGPGESKQPVTLPESAKGLHMSIHRQDVPARTRAAAAPETADIREIYPGARRADPVSLHRRRRISGSEAGMATAEYAIATLAAVGFAGILVFIMRSDEVRGFLMNLIRTALALP
jgi:hypothetical protein